MEFSCQEEKRVEETVAAADKDMIQLTEIQLLAVGGGIADVTLS